MKPRSTPPGAKRLIESLRNLGYACPTAIADLMDNSLAAGATQIHVDIYGLEGKRPPYVMISDNGSGMNRDDLYEAMRFASYQEYGAGDLGKFGLGLKTASLSQCRKLTVVSKSKSSRVAIARWDLDYLYKSRRDEWNLLEMDTDDLLAWEQDIVDPKSLSGTRVLWSDLEALPLMASDDRHERESFCDSLVYDVGEHLRMVFHRFMQGEASGHKKVRIFVNGDELKAWDPFSLSESTRKLKGKEFPLLVAKADGRAQKERVTFQPYVLPSEGEFSSPAAFQEASGPEKWNRQQGFYFYRNDRLLQAGGWSNLRTSDEHNKLLRVAVDFPTGLDKTFALNITKMRAHIPPEIRKAVRESLTEWVRVAQQRYRSSGSGRSSPKPKPSPKGKAPAAVPSVKVGAVTINPSNAPSSSIGVSKGAKQGQIKVVMPIKHEFSEVFEDAKDTESELRKLAITMFMLLEAIYDEKIYPEEIPLDSLRKELRKQL